MLFVCALGILSVCQLNDIIDNSKNYDKGGGIPILSIGKANFQGGGRKHSLAPPEINPVMK